MANCTFLNITAFGTQESLSIFDLFPPKFKGPHMEISSNGKSRKIYSEFKSQVTSEVLYGLVGQMQDLSLLIDIEIEPGYAQLLYREKYNCDIKNLFEIPDFRDDEFFTKFNADFLKKFDKITLNPNLKNLISSSPTGKTYLNLLNNPNYYINI